MRVHQAGIDIWGTINSLVEIFSNPVRTDKKACVSTQALADYVKRHARDFQAFPAGHVRDAAILSRFLMACDPDDRVHNRARNLHRQLVTAVDEARRTGASTDITRNDRLFTIVSDIRKLAHEALSAAGANQRPARY